MNYRYLLGFLLVGCDLGELEDQLSYNIEHSDDVGACIMARCTEAEVCMAGECRLKCQTDADCPKDQWCSDTTLGAMACKDD